MSGIRLWADDNRPAPEGWVWAKNVEQAQARLLQGSVEDLSLDFDFDNPDCDTCDFKCGYRDETGVCGKSCQCHTNGDQDGLELVNWMERWNVWPKHKPIVHSTNGHGSEEMKQLIDQSFPG